jgi:hypothetical protein
LPQVLADANICLKFIRSGLIHKLKVNADFLEIVKVMLQADVNSISKPLTDKLFSIYTDYIPEFLKIGQIIAHQLSHCSNQSLFLDSLLRHSHASVSHGEVFVEFFTQLCHSSPEYRDARLIRCHQFLHRLMIDSEKFDIINACLVVFPTFPLDFEHYDFENISSYLNHPETGILNVSLQSGKQ